MDTHGLGRFDRIRGSLRCVRVLRMGGTLRGSFRCVRELRMGRTPWVALIVSVSCEWVGLRGLLRCVRELRMGRTPWVASVCPRVANG